MREIKKKIWPEYFQLIQDGKKTNDLRLADFECSEGDTLILKEWDPNTLEYTGREIKKLITHITKTKDQEFWNKEEVDKHGFQVISFK